MLFFLSFPLLLILIFFFFVTVLNMSFAVTNTIDTWEPFLFEPSFHTVFDTHNFNSFFFLMSFFPILFLQMKALTEQVLTQSFWQTSKRFLTSKQLAYSSHNNPSQATFFFLPVSAHSIIQRFIFFFSKYFSA